MHILGFFIFIIIAVLLFTYSGSSSLANTSSVLFNPTTLKAFAGVCLAISIFVLFVGNRRKA